MDSDGLSRALLTVSEKNSLPVVTDLCEVVLKLLANLLEEPSNPKFRTLRGRNPALQAKLWGVRGGPELMRSLGWVTKVRDMEELWEFFPGQDTSKEQQEVLRKAVGKLQKLLEVSQGKARA
eukprot:RCo037078